MNGQWVRRHKAFITFAVIGAINTMVHGAVLVGAMETWQLPLLLSHCLAFMVANLFSYVANSRITFKVAFGWRSYTRFLLASLLALGLTLSLAWVASQWGLHYVVGFAIIVLTVPLFSFVIIKCWAFAGHRSIPSHHA